MQTDFSQNYFSLFHFEPKFEMDMALLTQRYRDIQSQVHPDRFSGKSNQEQRIAMQYTAYVNEAYQCLKNPLERARYLLKILGHEANLDTQSHLDAGFLMEQIELREQLEQIAHRKNAVQMDVFDQKVSGKIKVMQQSFLQQFAAGQFERAKDSVAKWQFLVKLQHDVENIHDHD